MFLIVVWVEFLGGIKNDFLERSVFLCIRKEKRKGGRGEGLEGGREGWSIFVVVVFIVERRFFG